MASKTQMFRLLRLIDQGACQDEVVEAAWDCWRALPLATQEAMVCGGKADGRRARVWAAGWLGGVDLVAEEVVWLRRKVRELEKALHADATYLEVD